MNGDIPEFKRRYRYMVIIVCLTFAVLVGRLWQVQIMQGKRFQKASEDNFIQVVRIASVRGLVMDRRRRPMITNRPSYNVYVTPRFTNEAALERLVQELALDPRQAEELKYRVSRAEGEKRYHPMLVERDISRDHLARLETHKQVLSGVRIMARAHRNYLHGNLAAHLLGYMNEVTAEELQGAKGQDYVPGDLIGRFGIERLYESHLRGVHGQERIVVDARGHRKRGKEVELLLGKERRVEPRPGHNLVLTIDLEVQRLVERALRRYPSGAAVVLEVNTGRVLASASKPAFDPNLLSGRLSQEESRRLLDNPHRPLLDKVFREHYFPGSTYKVVPAIAALEDHLILPDDTVMCKGWHRLGRRNFRCSHAHGNVNMEQAIIQSCNVYFYTLSERVGMDRMARYARLLGLGAPTGVGLNGEVGGFIPTKEWYARRKQPFRIGFTLNAAIGQGNTKATPIQIASLYAAIASGGALYLPQVVERVETSSGQLVQDFKPRLRRKVQISPKTLKVVRAGLKGVVNNEEGTAYEVRPSNLMVSGKTGTAQVSRRARKGETIWLQDHSWFAAYAPSDAPVIAVAVIIEHGGRAAKVAAPVAMEIIQGYFRYVEPKGAVGRRAAID
jgi:penicillin-binding protein 2